MKRKQPRLTKEQRAQIAELQAQLDRMHVWEGPPPVRK